MVPGAGNLTKPQSSLKEPVIKEFTGTGTADFQAGNPRVTP
jgi:hypothetical protein